MTDLAPVHLKESDLLECGYRYKRLLSTLYKATTAILEINNVNVAHNDLDSFLRANDLANGQSFDPSTLPPTDALLGHLNVSTIDSGQNQYEHFPNRENILSTRQELLAGTDETRNGLETVSGERGRIETHVQGTDSSSRPADKSIGPENLIQDAPAATKQNDKSAPSPVIAERHEGTDQNARLHPPEVLPLSSDDAISLPSNTLQDVAADQSTTKSQTLYLPPKETQAELWAKAEQDSDDVRDEREKHIDKGFRSLNGLTPPTSEEDAGRPRSKGPETVRGHESPADNALKAQLDIARAQAFGTIPSTPDQQLRLEEAQSLHQLKSPAATYDGLVNGLDDSQSMKPPSSLCSQFTNENHDDGATMPIIPEANDEASAQDISMKERDALNSPESVFQGPTPSRFNGELSRDITLSRRPPMRIDTEVISSSEVANPVVDVQARTQSDNAPAVLDSSTPQKAVAPVASAQSPPERMTTRVSSGAIRHKSVSEILGETPKATLNQPDKSPFDRAFSDPQKDEFGPSRTPKSISSPTTPDATIFKQRLNELKDRERSKLSTVVFAGSRNQDATQSQRLGVEEALLDKDYFMTLYTAQASTPPRAHPLNALVKQAHKTLSTSDQYTENTERQACRILSRIYELQSNHLWCLRQIERSAELTRPVTHLDVLLGQMKWMRTDFREERKWKLAAAKFTADACAGWVASSPEDRVILQVKVRNKPPRAKSRSLSVSTPGLVHSLDDDHGESSDEEPQQRASTPESAPAAMFSLPPDMFLFGLNKSPVAEKLLNELPLYEPNAKVQDAALDTSMFQPDARWKKPLVEVSKYACGKLVCVEEGPSRKKARFSYEDIEPAFAESSTRQFEPAINPEQDDVALFDPVNKHIRDRIHAGHAFRPPSEFIMPSQSFFESRQSSQWTQAEDDELRVLVKDYAYNWSLISSCLTPQSVFSSGAERRTPWECFERWIGLEGLPVEMAKINYFRAYHSRLQAAQKTVESQQQAAIQQHGSNPLQAPIRRRTTQPYTVLGRKNQRHLHMIDAMRKLAKKRETALHKQQHVASLAAMRKATETGVKESGVKPKKETRTPQYWSQLKHQRDEQYRANIMHLQQQKAQIRNAQPPGQQMGSMPPSRNPVPAVPGMHNGGSLNTAVANSHAQMRAAVTEPSRPVPQMQRAMNSQTNGILPTNSHSVPHAPMHPNVQMPMPMQHRLPPNMGSDNSRILEEATRVQQQQAYLQSQRQQRPQQVGGHAGSPQLQHPNLLSQNNTAVLAPLQGRTSPAVNGVLPPIGSSASPRMNQPQALSSGVTPAINQISTQVRALHPGASPERIKQITTEQLYKLSEASRQQAMQAAAGNANLNAVASNSNMGLPTPNPMQQAPMMSNGTSSNFGPQQYAQFMRNQQASQQRSGSSGNAQSVNGSRSVTPLIQRSGSAQGVPRPSQSPSARQVGLAGGQ